MNPAPAVILRTQVRRAWFIAATHHAEPGGTCHRVGLPSDLKNTFLACRPGTGTNLRFC